MGPFLAVEFTSGGWDFFLVVEFTRGGWGLFQGHSSFEVGGTYFRRSFMLLFVVASL